ncbi:hypothetical protein [Candidatus Amarolinea dominans]|uniref:hypothetical protein n=1 Tax=Candidatus Amarolinea dominans TaxID=3140696 RepID=UPI001DD77E05|nr:hypothetical protein [Anaerolineae bacterium]
MDIADAALKKAVIAEIQTNGKGFVALAGPDAPVDFQVAVNAAGEFEIQDAGDEPIPNLRPPVKADAAGVGKVVQRLVHLSKYANVRELDVPDKSAPQNIEIAISGAQSVTDGSAPTYRDGDRVKLTITNTQQPNPADPNDPGRMQYHSDGTRF